MQISTNYINMLQLIISLLYHYILCKLGMMRGGGGVRFVLKLHVGSSSCRDYCTMY